VIDAGWRGFMASRRTATLATLSTRGQPRLVPICFVIAEPGGEDPRTTVWSPLDAKPKQKADVRRLARVRDIVARPEVTLLFERWSEDWSRLAWLRARGLARLVEPIDAAEPHRRAVDALRAKYPQYRDQQLETRPMIRVVIIGATGWSAMPEAPVEPD
jgi:PPOX class probable F420-dependent enzyme